MKQGASSTLFFILLLPVPNLPLKKEIDAKKKYYDTAASKQITGDPNAFVSFAPYFFVYGWQLSIVNSIGKVVIQNACAGTIVLSDVLYVPKVKEKRFSYQLGNYVMISKQCEVKLTADSCMVKDLPPDQRSSWYRQKAWETGFHWRWHLLLLR